MSNTTILLIDYEPKSIDRVRRPLTSSGYSVEVATDGLAGIEAFHRLKPDLVMIEAMIPKKHGFEVCQELKKTPHGKRTPIVITTSVYKGRKYRNQAFHIHGCDEYLEKPLDEAQVLSVCNRLLGKTAGVATPAAPAADHDEAPLGSAPSMSATTHSSPEFAPPPTLDDDELEILARLDAILPGGGQKASAPAPPVLSAAPAPPAPPAPPAAEPMPAAPEATATTAEASASDPFATSFIPSMVPPLSIEPVSSARAQMDSEPSGFQGESRRSNKKKDRNRKKSHSGSQPGDTASATAVAEAPVETAVELVSIEAAPEEPMVVTEMAMEPLVEPLAEPATPPTMEAVFVEPEDSSRQGWFSWPAILILVAGAALLAYILFGGLFGPN